MKKTIIIFALLIAASVSAVGQMSDKGLDKTETNKSKEQVAALATDFANALVKGDTATLERILSDDYADVTPAGFPTPKKLLVDYFKINHNNPKVPVLEAINIKSDLSYIRIYGDTEIMVVPATAKWHGADNLAQEQAYTATLVAIKKNERWQFVAAHYSEVKTQVSQTR